jgi:hypothetical protein
MTQADAKNLIMREWLQLPNSSRKTGDQAALFAMQLKDKYPFHCSGDRYQVIKGWLQNRLST